MAEKLNLSARLDRARAQREAGLAPDPGRTEYDLRFRDEEGQTYEGRGIRTGEHLTADQWRDREAVTELPTWKGRSLLDDATLVDLTAPGDAEASPHACPTCGREAEVETIDLERGTTRLGCQACGRVWHVDRPPRP